MKRLNIYISLAIAIVFLAQVLNYKVFAGPFSGRVSKNHLKIEKLIEKGRYDQALKDINKILKDNPDDLNARAYLGSVYSAQYKLGAATREYGKVLAKDSDNAAAHNGLGLVYYRKTTSSDMQVRKNIQKLREQALSEFLKAIKAAPTFYQAYNNAGIILFDQGRIPEAETCFEKALELKPNYSEAIENYGKVLFAKNKPDEAIEQYKKAIKLNTKNSSAYYHLGEALIAKGAYSEAIKQLQTSLYLFPNSAPVHNMLGKAYEMQKNEPAAIAEYKKASMIKPDYPAPYLSLADIYKNRGDAEFAIAELRNALAINSDFYAAKAKIAEISLNIGKIDQTIKYYKELLNVPEYRQRALTRLSKAYFIKAREISSHTHIASEKEFLELENALREALRYNPENLELYLGLLRLSRASQKDAQSEIYLKHILKNAQNNRIDHITRGESHLSFNEFNKAESEFLQALNSSRGVSDLINMAEIFTINRSYSAAKIALNRVLAIEPNNIRAIRSKQRIEKYEEQAISKFNVAEGFYRERQRPAAIEAYRDALSLNPYLAQAHLGLAKSFEKEDYYYNAAEHYKAYVNLVALDRNTHKYRAKIERLERKIVKMKEDNKPVKKFSRI